MTRRRLEHFLTVGCFVSLLLSPWVAGALGMRASASAENRSLVESPDLSASRAFDSTQFAEVEAFVIDHLPLRQEAAGAINQVMYSLTRESPVENAFVDRSGNWFLAEDFLHPCIGPFDPASLAATLASWEAQSAGTTDLVLVVAPDKSVIVDGGLGARTRIANNCQVQRERELRAAFPATGDLLDLWTTLDARVEADPAEPTYFTNDSHWTSWGALVMAETLVDDLRPGLFDASHVIAADTVAVTGDITRRLGWLRDEPSEEFVSDRPNVATALVVQAAGSTQGIRVHRSTSSDPDALVPGVTLVVHDSMMNYAEGMLAPYFEHIEFVHWNDLADPSFMRRAASADRIVFQVVQRDISARSVWPFADPAFDHLMRDALRP